MKLKIGIVLSMVLVLLSLGSAIRAQVLDGSDLRKEVRERDDRVNRLSTEEQLKLRAAEQKAAQDPEVRAALQKRNKAIEEFRVAVRASMVRADPDVEAILEKVAIPPKTP